LKSRPKPIEEYTPKFIAGDIIINKYIKNGQVMNLICKINKLIRDENDLECRRAQYELQTLFNNGVKQKVRSRLSLVRSIDAYYNIIKPEMAQVLYGIEVRKRIDIKKPTVKG
jgi:hypothetical protein